MKHFFTGLVILVTVTLLNGMLPVRAQLKGEVAYDSGAQTLFQNEGVFEDPDEDFEAGGGLPESIQLAWVSLFESRQVRAEHRLNPEEALVTFSETESVTGVDLDWSPRLADNYFLRTRALLSHGQLDSVTETEGYLLEGYLQWQSPTRTLVVDAGKIRVEWGSGYAWNPTQLLKMPTKHSNSLVDDHEGTGMLRVSWNWDLLTLTAIAADPVEEPLADDEDPIQAVVKGSIVLDQWEIEMVYSRVRDHAPASGVSFSGLLSDAFEIHGEWSTTRERDRNRIEKTAEGINMGPLVLPARYDYIPDERGVDFNRILLGGQFTFANDMNIIFELFRTTHGYDESEWKNARNGIEAALSGDAWKNSDFPYTTSRGNPYAGFLLNTLSAIRQEQLRRNYLFLRFTSGETDHRWEWEQILMLNLDDSSQMHQLELHKSWHDSLNSSLALTVFSGSEISEFGLHPYRERFALAVDYHF